MKKVNIKSDKKNISISCFNCDNWEELGIDEPRKNLNSIEIIEWKKDEKNQPEKSVNQCNECGEKMLVVWDYNNELITTKL